MGLVVGEQSAALIDTSWGAVGNLRVFVAELTDRPVKCFLTHAHPDHLGASAQFDEVYMHPADDSILLWSLSLEKKFSDISKHGRNNPALIEAMKTEATDCSGLTYSPLSDGECFDLGNVHMKVMNVPGHTAGSVVFYCEEDDVLFAGDAIGKNIMMIGEGPEPAVPLSDYRDALVRVRETVGDETQIFNGHTTESIGIRVIQDLIEACNKVLDGKGNPEIARLKPRLQKKAAESPPHREQYGEVSITYAEASL